MQNYNVKFFAVGGPASGWKIIFLGLIFYGIFGLAGSSLAAEPVTYYVDDNDCSDDYAGTSLDQPLCTFTEAMTKLQAGDTLIIKDGTYYQSLTVTVSGTQTDPIAIKALNDGQAIVDGQNNSIPCQIQSVTDITLEGVKCMRSSGNVVYVRSSSRITIKRVSGYDATTSVSNNAVFLAYQSSYVTFEDCAASGVGLSLYTASTSSHITFRRCWGKWVSHPSSAWKNALDIYGSSNCVVENCVLTTASSSVGAGIQVVKQTWNAAADNNRVLGNVVYNFTGGYGYIISGYYGGMGTAPTGNVFKHNVAVDVGYGMGFRASGTGENFTIVNANKQADSFAVVTDKSEASWSLDVALKNSSLLTGLRGMSNSDADTFTHAYNTLFGFNVYYSGTGAGLGEQIFDPSYDTATYGKGACLIVPSALQGQGESGADIGAEVLYRYENGVLTSTPLWPWPMEDRVLAETGISVTYESSGGIWTTLDGVYENGDTTPPAAPSGLSVN